MYPTSHVTRTPQSRLTRSSADADNGLDAFSGQSRSTNIVRLHNVTYSFLLCNSNSSLRRAVFTIFDFKKCRDLENRVRGPSRSLEMPPCDTEHMTFYWRSVVNMALSHVVSEIFNVENVVTEYGFLLVFCCNFVPKMHCFWDIQLVSIHLETLVRGHSMSSKMIPFNPAPMTSY